MTSSADTNLINLFQKRMIEEFKELEFADYEGDSANLPVGILTGIDYCYAFMTGKVVRSRAGPVACKTRVGWVLSGRIGPGPPDLHCFETHLLRTAVEHREDSDTLRQELHKFWSVETVGSPNNCVVSQFENDIMHDGNRYVTKNYLLSQTMNHSQITLMFVKDG